MSELPVGWKIAALGELCEKIVDGSHNPPKGIDIGTPMISARNIKTRKISFDNCRYLSDLDFESENRRTNIEPEDILLTIVGTIGRVAVVPRDTARFSLQRSVAVLRSSVCDSRYLSFMLESPRVQKCLEEDAKGTAQKGIYLNALSKILIPVAPFEEQKRIADKLDTLLSKVEATRTRLNYIPQLLKHFRQSVLTAATTGQLTEDWREQQGLTDEGSSKDTGDKANAITRDWHDRAYNKGDKRELKEALASIKTGPFGSALHKADYVSGGVPLINPMHINDGRITPSDNMTVNAEILERLTDFKVRFGDVVIGRRGEMGRCAVVGKKEAGWLCGTGSMVLTPLPTLDAKYLQMFLSSPETVKTLRGESVGSTMVNLNQQILLSLEIYFPSIKEQQEIIHRVETLFALADKIQARYQSAQAQVDKLTPALLAKAFQGKLLPQNPNDEPASTLLARLRAERENEPVKKWSRKVKALNGDAS